jgi:hypothetical protein
MPPYQEAAGDGGEVREQRQVIVLEGYDCEVVVAVHLWWRNSQRDPVVLYFA